MNWRGISMMTFCVIAVVMTGSGVPADKNVGSMAELG